ncbi:complexed with cef1p [Borealophlyctis nickersoniae]|nr:complexed with cef1p [Borealophlyctis nickersoniae]
MTTAARPTWLPALGGHTLRDRGNAPLHQKSARDLASHTKLKTRQVGQNAPEELSRVDLKAKLGEKEREHFEKANKGRPREDEQDGEDQPKKRRLLEPMDLDKDDSDEEEDGDSDSDSSDSDDDEEDDTAELLRELEKIKRERAEEKERQERERAEQEEKEREEAAMTGNPLLASGETSFAVKRRWDDDVIFKNQAKGVDENPKKRFINDMLRSDFHRKFMSKYVK